MQSLNRLKNKLSRYFKPEVDVQKSIPVGVFSYGSDIELLVQGQKLPYSAYLSKSTDAFSFSLHNHPLHIIDDAHALHVTFAHSFTMNSEPFLLYRTSAEAKKETHIGSLKNDVLTPVHTLTFTNEPISIVSEYKYKDRYVAYFGQRAISPAYSLDLENWEVHKKPFLFDTRPIEVGCTKLTHEGILILYYKKEIENGITYYSAHVALADTNAPDKILWKTEKPIWQQKEQWEDKKIRHIGTVEYEKRLISYWMVENEGIYGVVFSGFVYDFASISQFQKKIQLHKHPANPIIAPNAKNDWEAFNTFNPAAIHLNDAVHILYRAQGFDYVSSVGYAKSLDGIHIDERSAQPIFSPTQTFEKNPYETASQEFISGGGYGGCEDPRVTLMGNRVYMTYVAFDGWSPPRLAITSILVEDFLKKRWLWSKPVLISPPGIIDKSGCLLPEKINGKYVFFHRVFPNILIDYVDDLNFDGKTKWLTGQHQIKVRENMWDSRKIGAGGPPIKTEHGWLLIYYGVDDRDASKYHIGAMLLDLKDPSHVLHRSAHPILSPTKDYENNGFKAGVAYPCGAVVVDSKLMVYYGGADSVVCVAVADMNQFLTDLMTNEDAKLTPVQIKEVILS